MPLRRGNSLLLRAAFVIAPALALPVAAQAQHAGSAPPPAHAKVCADGVVEYYSKGDIPTPYDTLVMPPGEPVRVTSPEEAEAAQRLMRERAGSVGATGILVLEERTDDGMGRVQMSRSLTPVFAPSDTARAYAACRGKDSRGYSSAASRSIPAASASKSSQRLR